MDDHHMCDPTERELCSRGPPLSLMAVYPQTESAPPSGIQSEIDITLGYVHVVSDCVAAAVVRLYDMLAYMLESIPLFNFAFSKLQC